MEAGRRALQEVALGRPRRQNRDDDLAARAAFSEVGDRLGNLGKRERLVDDRPDFGRQRSRWKVDGAFMEQSGRNRRQRSANRPAAKTPQTRRIRGPRLRIVARTTNMVRRGSPVRVRKRASQRASKWLFCCLARRGAFSSSTARSSSSPRSSRFTTRSSPHPDEAGSQVGSDDFPVRVVRQWRRCRHG